MSVKEYDQAANTPTVPSRSTVEINYDELYNLKGRLLTLIDATYTDPQQRKAQKDLVWQTLQRWITDCGLESHGITHHSDEPAR